ncbi:MAG: PilZ domain-containing protein [Rhodospirillales bacterium]
MTTGDHARRHARAEVSFEATLTVGGKTAECRIQNISAGGAQVATRMALTRGDDVVLKIGVMGEAAGAVAWVGRGSVGIKFAHDIDTIGDLLMAVAIY